MTDLKNPPPGKDRPDFIDELGRAYTLRRKNTLVLTGDVTGLFWSPAARNYLSLEQTLDQELGGSFQLLSLDIASGINFYRDETRSEVIRVCESTDGYYVPQKRLKAIGELLESVKHSPLSALVLLSGMVDAFRRVRRLEPKLKPLCVIIRFAGALFPAGEFGRLSDLDRQTLVSFLSWVNNPAFRDSPELIVMINPVKTDLNQQILSLPQSDHIAINLPDNEERARFIHHFTHNRPGMPRIEAPDNFVEDCAGLTLPYIKDILEVASRSGKAVSRKEVNETVNTLLQNQLGDIIRIKRPSHGPADVVGYKKECGIFNSIFHRCEDPETAVSAILVSGPNGSGKTFQLEAYASVSGRIVIELAGIRGSYFGETDRFFELLRWHIETFGKILILVDEAHTAFGSVHSRDTHQTEQRLSGNIIKMMGDPRFLGKVLWGLMTSRPDELDPDIKSRAPLQIPLFDLEGEERKVFVTDMFKRKKISLSEEETTLLLQRTDYYSARDYRNLIAETLAQRKMEPRIPITTILDQWQASKSIKAERLFQEMVAAQHCSYPQLLPERYRSLSDADLTDQIELMKVRLRH